MTEDAPTRRDVLDQIRAGLRRLPAEVDHNCVSKFERAERAARTATPYSIRNTDTEN